MCPPMGCVPSWHLGGGRVAAICCYTGMGWASGLPSALWAGGGTWVPPGSRRGPDLHRGVSRVCAVKAPRELCTNQHPALCRSLVWIWTSALCGCYDAPSWAGSCGPGVDHMRPLLGVAAASGCCLEPTWSFPTPCAPDPSMHEGQGERRERSCTGSACGSTAVHKVPVG